MSNAEEHEAAELQSGRLTVPASCTEAATLTGPEADELKQLALLLAELERELGESDDPDLRFAAAFARQCALGNWAAD